MATIVWTTIFFFLLFELAVTLILVIPVPLKIRNWICRKVFAWNVEDHLRIPVYGIGLALAFALVDCYSSLQYIFSIEAEDGHLQIRDREKEYKTERNAYLAGFALTLLLVIVRVVDLMQEHVELEDSLTQSRNATINNTNAVDSIIDENASAVQVEMTSLSKKPDDKKKD